MRGMASVAFAVSSSLLFAASAARADEAPASEAAPPPPPPLSPPIGDSQAPMPPPPPGADEDPTLRKTVAERRAGVVIGVTPGIAFAGASGYPNNSRLVGNP